MQLRTFAALSLSLLFATAATAQRFPLKPGEWEMTSDSVAPGQMPMAILFCFKDDLWAKALSQRPECSVQNVTLSETGATYDIDCPLKNFHMSGAFHLTFDGMTHMTSKGTLNFDVNGQSMYTNTQSDFHWRQTDCKPEDVNLKQHPGPS